MAKNTTDLSNLKINHLTYDQFNQVVTFNEVEENELYLLNGTNYLGAIPYVTQAPTSQNYMGLRIALLDEEPQMKYDGWIYLIKES